MSFMKKITSFLFEETDADIIAEDELEEVTLKEKKEKPVHHEAPVEKKAEPVRMQETKTEPVKTVEEPRKFVSIDLDTKKEAAKEAKATAEAVEKLTRTTVKKEEKHDFEFTPVISPIFGAKEEEGTAQSKEKKVSVSIPHTRKKKENPLGTIISPYYGVSELEEFEEEAMKDIEAKEKRRKEEVQIPVETTPVETSIEDMDLQAVAAPLELEEEVEDTLPLEDILAEDEVDGEDDLLQISLFGESAPLREAEASNKPTSDR